MSWPTNPKPTTTMRAPGPISARRMPLSAMLPTVAKAASSNETPSGIRATRLPATNCRSAWGGPCSRDPLPRPEVGHSLADGDDFASRRIPERHVLGKPGSYGADRRPDAGAPSTIDDLPD